MMRQPTGWLDIRPLVLGMAVVIALPTAGWAHGVVGKRFFPATVVVEDPFVADEAGVVIGHRREPEALSTEFEAEISKRLSRDVAITLGGSYQITRPRGEEEESTGATSGFQNPDFGLRYQFIRNALHEMAATAAVSVSPGGVGQRRIGRLSGTTVSPAIQIGKGFGDLPDWADWLKPIAVTTSVGTDLRTNRNEREEDAQHAFAWGATVMYSIPYLQSFVKDVGIPWPLNRFFPIVEFNGERVLTGPERGTNAAFANPGLIWAGRYLEFAAEAQIPLNDTSGRHTGFFVMMHFFIDDIAPNIFTRTPFHGVLGPTQAR
ncbi:MAG: hypothetical protein C3F08_10620 [Candidatus Methylomirabilota bacterium]|nr:MAG: hypothetical protein C3F08_10620 [candidate division NC10 bacterium]